MLDGVAVSVVFPPGVLAFFLTTLVVTVGVSIAGTFFIHRRMTRKLHTWLSAPDDVVVYEALCGQVPFPRGSSEAMLVSKNTKEPIPLDQQDLTGSPDVGSGLL